MAGNITHGMNVEQVKALGAKLDAKANQINALITEVNNALQNTSWVGPDADSFKNKWSHEGVGQLNKAKEILTHASAAAKRNAQAQDSTSQAQSGQF